MSEKYFVILLFLLLLASKVFENYLFPGFRVLIIPEKSTRLEYYMTCHTWQLLFSETVFQSNFGCNMNYENIKQIVLEEFWWGLGEFKES